MAVVAKFIPASSQKSSYKNVDTPPSVAFYLFKRKYIPFNWWQYNRTRIRITNSQNCTQTLKACISAAILKTIVPACISSSLFVPHTSFKRMQLMNSWRFWNYFQSQWNRKHFGNEDLRQETEFNICMKSERLAHFSFFVCLQMLSQMVVVKQTLIANGFGTSISRSYPFLHLCTVRWHLISFPIGKWLIVDNFNLHTVCT